MTPEQVSYWLVFSPSHSSQQLYLKTHDPWWHLWEWNNCTIFSSWLFAYLESCDEKSSQKWPWRYYSLCFPLTVPIFFVLFCFCTALGFHLWPVCMQTCQMFLSPFMRGADFLVANVMLSSILPARHRAVKLFQSTEVNASKAWYCGGRSL